MYCLKLYVLHTLTACDNGTYGDQCVGKCGKCLGDVPCQVDTGLCQSGICDAGYSGDLCQEGRSSSFLLPPFCN